MTGPVLLAGCVIRLAPQDGADLDPARTDSIDGRRLTLFGVIFPADWQRRSARVAPAALLHRVNQFVDQDPPPPSLAGGYSSEAKAMCCPRALTASADAAVLASA